MNMITYCFSSRQCSYVYVAPDPKWDRASEMDDDLCNDSAHPINDSSLFAIHAELAMNTCRHPQPVNIVFSRDRMCSADFHALEEIFATSR